MPSFADPSAVVRSPLRGVLLLAAALLLFAGMDCMTKYLVARYEVPLVVAMRYIVNCLLMVAILAPTQGRALVATRRTGLVLVRAGTLVAASLFMGLALQRMPVAESTAIVFLAPILVVLVAPLLLSERLGALNATAAVAGFGGVLMIARPGGGLEPTAVALVLCAAVATAGYMLLSRVLANTERTVTLLFYTALIGSIVFGLALPWYWSGPAPTAWQLLLFLGMGAVGGLGHYLFTLAYRHAPAALLAPVSYLQLFWAGLLGWLLFGDVPDGASVLGMVVVVASGVIIALQSRRPVVRAGIPATVKVVPATASPDAGTDRHFNGGRHAEA